MFISIKEKKDKQNKILDLSLLYIVFWAGPD